jgi:3-deoxy-manno-octulosonate cytidylyltransferase (CMP-KDO synthetase)
MATLARPLEPGEYGDPNAVKVLWDEHGLALYFSRAAIPFNRDRPGHPPAGAPRAGARAGLRMGLHVGLYAYRAGFLRRLSAARPCALELAERLEQLRALDMGERIAVAFTRQRSASVDSPADAARVRRLL